MDNSSVACLVALDPAGVDCSLHTDTRLLFDESLEHIFDSLPLWRSFVQTASPLILTTLRTTICFIQTLVMWKILEFDVNLLNADIMLP